MNPGKVVTIARSNTPLAIGAPPVGVFLSDVMQVGTTVEKKEIPGGGFTLLKGFINSDVNGTLEVFQGWSFADINAITAAVPVAGNAALFRQVFNFVSAGVANNGTPYTVALVAPFVRLRYTNGAVIQATFRLHFEVAE